MALSKLAIGLIAGIGSVAVIGGITAGIVVSRNNTIAETTNETDEFNGKETDKASILSEMNEPSLMEDQPRNDSINNDEDSINQTEITPTNQGNKSDSVTTSGHIGKPISSTDKSSDSSTRDMEKQEAASPAEPERPQNDQVGTDTQVQGSSAASSAASTSKTGQSVPSIMQGTEGDSAASNEARSVGVVQEGEELGNKAS